MKLTHEGAARLGRYESRGFPVGDFEFKPEDFDGCCQNGKDHVVLTVEEAKDLRDTFLILCEIADVNENSSLNFKNLVKRIKQAEKKDE